jgi:hypothetical protein
MRSSPNSPRNLPDAADTFVKCFQALTGAWDLERTISDGSSFAGSAVFSPFGDDKLLLVEEGLFRPAGLTDPSQQPMPAGRQWVWRLVASNQLEISYPEPDGRLYHCFRPVLEAGDWRGAAEHLCGADTYRADYRLGANSMEIVHDVAGPAKDYRLTSRFSRRRAS